MQFIKNQKTYFAHLNKRVVFGGITRNSASYIETALMRVRELGSLFQKYHIVVYENDSMDNTVSLLKKTRVNYISEQYGYKEYNSRDPNPTSLDRMAHYRNQLKKSLDKYDVDYIIILDFDVQHISWDGFFYSFSHEFDACFARGLCVRENQSNYYDYFAHREVGCIDDGINQECVKKYGESKNTSLIPVDSAFGGIAIYKKEVYMAGTYEGGQCEHVPFHKSLKARGFNQLFINPLLVTLHK